MKTINIKRKFIAIYILLLLVLSSNLIPKLSSELISDYDDGVIYDEFNNSNNISLKNCSLIDGYIELSNESYSLYYNYNATSDKIKSWMLTDTYITPGTGDFIKLISSFINPNVMPGYEFTNSEYSKIKKRDNVAVEIESYFGPYMNYVYYPMNLFRFEIKEDPDLIDNFTAIWWSGAYTSGANLDRKTSTVR